MALLWHKESGAWKDRTDALSFKSSGAWGKKPTYYKAGGAWHLLGSIKSEIEWKTEDLCSMASAEAFSAYVAQSFAGVCTLQTNNITKATKVATHEAYGFKCQYGDSVSRTDTDPILFATTPMQLPKRIVFSVVFEDTSAAYMNIATMGLGIVSGRVNPRLLLISDNSGSGWAGSKMGFFINADLNKVSDITKSGTYSYTFDIKIPDDVPDCNLVEGQKYSLYWCNPARRLADNSTYYQAGPIYVQYLRIEL